MSKTTLGLLARVLQQSLIDISSKLSAEDRDLMRTILDPSKDVAEIIAIVSCLPSEMKNTRKQDEQLEMPTGPTNLLEDQKMVDQVTLRTLRDMALRAIHDACTVMEVMDVTKKNASGEGIKKAVTDVLADMRKMLYPDDLGLNKGLFFSYFDSKFPEKHTREEKAQQLRKEFLDCILKLTSTIRMARTRVHLARPTALQLVETFARRVNCCKGILKVVEDTEEDLELAQQRLFFLERASYVMNTEAWELLFDVEKLGDMTAHLPIPDLFTRSYLALQRNANVFDEAAIKKMQAILEAVQIFSLEVAEGEHFPFESPEVETAEFIESSDNDDDDDDDDEASTASETIVMDVEQQLGDIQSKDPSSFKRVRSDD